MCWSQRRRRLFLFPPVIYQCITLSFITFLSGKIVEITLLKWAYGWLTNPIHFCSYFEPRIEIRRMTGEDLCRKFTHFINLLWFLLWFVSRSNVCLTVEFTKIVLRIHVTVTSKNKILKSLYMLNLSYLSICKLYKRGLN